MEEIASNFIHDIIDAQLALQRNGWRDYIHTRSAETERIPAYGSAKAIYINYMTPKEVRRKVQPSYDQPPKKRTPNMSRQFTRPSGWACLTRSRYSGGYIRLDYFDKCCNMRCFL